jgi:hypothetical protein
MSKSTLEIMNPIARIQMEEGRVPRARPQDLRGKTVGLLDTRKPNADVFMDRIQERLQSEACGVAKIVRRRKPTIANEPTPRGIITELAGRCDLVIHGIAD